MQKSIDALHGKSQDANTFCTSSNENDKIPKNNFAFYFLYWFHRPDGGSRISNCPIETKKLDILMNKLIESHKNIISHFSSCQFNYQLLYKK